jgi:hypothetical protein
MWIAWENHRPVASHCQTLSQKVVSSTTRHETRFKLTLVVIGTDCTGSCKSNYHTITTTIAPLFQRKKILQIYKFTKIVIFNVDCKLFSNYVNPFDIFKERTIRREKNFSNTPLIILYSPHIPLSSVPLKHDTVPSHTSCSGIHSPDEHL